MTAPVRLSCVVPFCRHTVGQRKGQPPIVEGAEWVCGQHWRHVSRHTKRRLARLRRLKERARQLGRQSVFEHLVRQGALVWEDAKRQAIEAAAGIA